ncbi:hypothetical protein J4208_02425 [Candidatus Woesearchaeota archaeon]|nr:hypothetical protein [Candidatus Woesearchaeota archaeon]
MPPFTMKEPFFKIEELPPNTVEMLLANHPSGSIFSFLSKVPDFITLDEKYNQKIAILTIGSATNVVGIVLIRYDSKDLPQNAPYNLDTHLVYGEPNSPNFWLQLDKRVVGSYHYAATEEEAIKNAKIIFNKFGISGLSIEGMDK